MDTVTTLTPLFIFCVLLRVRLTANRMLGSLIEADGEIMPHAVDGSPSCDHLCREPGSRRGDVLVGKAFGLHSVSARCRVNAHLECRQALGRQTQCGHYPPGFVNASLPIGESL